MKHETCQRCKRRVKTTEWLRVPGEAIAICERCQLAFLRTLIESLPNSSTVSLRSWLRPNTRSALMEVPHLAARTVTRELIMNRCVLAEKTPLVEALITVRYAPLASAAAGVLRGAGGEGFWTPAMEALESAYSYCVSGATYGG